MSTLSPQSTTLSGTSISGTSFADRLPAGPDGRAIEPQCLGLPISAWVKIGVLALLMLALYWVNLSRLWAKTNPFTGQGNWEHAIVIPLIGIYYLYVWRDQLLGLTKSEDDGNRWSLPGIWALILAVPLLLATATAPLLLAVSIRTSPAQLLSGLADGGLSRLIPLVFGVFVVAGAAAAYVYVRRQDLQYTSTQVWLSNVWHGLGAWLTGMIVLWGIGFFVAVLMRSYPSVVKGVSYAIAAIGVAGLAHIAFWGSSKNWRQRYDGILSGSSVWLGAFIMLWGILFSFYGIWPGQNDFFKDVGMVVALFGVVTLVAGWRVMSIAWFPIIFLFCAIPWPDQVYSWVALPLQNFAAKIGVFTLQLTGVEASQFGTKIVMVGAGGAVRTLNVAEACAGLKSLMTFVSVAAAVAFLSNRLLWQKVMIVASAVPIAILCNASRVAGQGVLDFYVSKEWSENFAHAFAGLVMLIPGFFLILGVCWVLDHLFVEEVDDKSVVRRTPGPGAGISAPVSAMTSAAPVSAAPASAAPVTHKTTARPAPGSLPAPAAKRVITIPKKQAAPVQAGPAPASPASASQTPARKPVPTGQPAPAATKPAARPPAASVRPAGSRGIVSPQARPAGVKPGQPAVASNAAPAAGKPAVARPSVAEPAPRPASAEGASNPRPEEHS